MMSPLLSSPLTSPLISVLFHHPLFSSFVYKYIICIYVHSIAHYTPFHCGVTPSTATTAMSSPGSASRARRGRKRATGTIDTNGEAETETEVEAEEVEEEEEREEEVVVELSPDIHKLFCFYNKLYFDDALGACIVRWSAPRMTSCAGTCHFLRGGGCEIHLSEPLLKKRSTADLKKTLLHEMIHAFLFITQNKKDRREHGPMFRDLMNTINSSSRADHQRPSGGYNITVYHDFHEEADSYRLHHWRCESCGDLIKRAINRKPSATDCIKKAGHGNVCGSSSCHWHSHETSCGGTYAKIAEPPGYKDRTKGSKGVQKTLDIKPEKPNVAILNNQGTHKSGVQKNLEIKLEKPNAAAILSNQGSHKSGVQKDLEIKPEKPNVVIPSNQESHKSGVQKNLEMKPGKPGVVIMSDQGSRKSEGTNDNCDTKMPHVITHFFHATCDKKKTMHSSSLEFEKPKIIESKLKKPFVVPEKQKNANSLESKKRKCNDTIKQQFGRGKKEFMVASAWLGYYADEESDENIEPLINKRTERRKRQKMLKKTIAAARENMAFATFPLDPSRSQKGSAKDFSLVPHENCDCGAQIVNVENVSAIDSDEIIDAEPLDHSAPLPLPSLPYASSLSKSPAQDIVIYISDDSD